MRHAASTTLARGRHRWGRPGLVHVTDFVAVAYRGLFASWRNPGRHAHRGVRAVTPTRLPKPAHAL